MVTRARKDYDDELATWLAECGLSRHEPQDADKLADLWEALTEAQAVKDKRPPISDEAHAKLDAALRAIGY